jgi:TonB family protein
MVPGSWRRPAALAALALLALAACGRAPAVDEGPRALPVDVYADTGRTTRMRIEPPPAPPSEPRAAVWLARVSPARAGLPGLPPPEAPPETLAVAPDPPPALAVDEGLKPPLLRSRAALAVPPGARGSVELDVRVDEQGAVAEVRWAGGTRDPAMVRAAMECARGMRFYPARRAGRPVAVWCRERFDFGGEGP